MLDADRQATEPYFAELRRREFARLDARHHAYLDYTGSALHAERQLRAHHTLLDAHVYGNPHSEHEPSRASTAVIDDARVRVLRLLDASDADYRVIFTANTSAAVKLVAESYPFGDGTELLLSSDNHNSVNGVREYAARAGAAVRYLPLDRELRLSDPAAALARRAYAGPALFAYPAQSNFSGVRHPLALIDAAHAHGWDVLLDAAAFIPSSRLSLSEHPADFVAFSFYKLFGYPTGIGALVARRSALSRLRRPWFAGGTVEFASVQNGIHRLRASAGAFEDGTPDFLGIAGLAPGFALIDEVGMDRLGAHVMHLTDQLLQGLQSLVHANGQPLARIYGPGDLRARGGTIAFNVLDATSRPVRHALVEARARTAGVSVRGGCFCNPGAAEAAFGFPAAAAAHCLAASARAGFTPDRFADCLGPGFAVGAVRASVGLANSAGDIRRAMEAISTFRDKEVAR